MLIKGLSTLNLFHSSCNLCPRILIPFVTVTILDSRTSVGALLSARGSGSAMYSHTATSEITLSIHESHVLGVTFSHRMSSDASREVNCYSLFGGCEIIAHEKEDAWCRVEGGWAPSGRDAREQGSVGGAALGCGVSGQEEEEVVYSSSMISSTCCAM